MTRNTADIFTDLVAAANADDEAAVDAATAELGQAGDADAERLPDDQRQTRDEAGAQR